MKQFLILYFLWLNVFVISAQNHHSRFESIDIQHYIFEIHVNDSTNEICGKTTITAKFIEPSDRLTLDLVGFDNSTKTGMIVSEVYFRSQSIEFNHQGNQLEIHFDSLINTNEIVSFEIDYKGIPADGLVISENKFGDRTFFGDNWPDRARHWLPTVDHPSDKATLDFNVFAPQNYKVIANGLLIEETNLENGEKLTRWKESVPLSTKLMVVGVARFAVINNGEFEGIPVSSWVFPQNQELGFKKYSVGKKALEFFSNLIGPYSYEKLAHVQSKTRYGGMENASCIFYAENSVDENKNLERLFAHETAHQWFGNSVTEQNWHHVWLSEGFATYLTHVYNQNFFGDEFFNAGLKNDRKQIIDFAKRKYSPIIDTTESNYNRLLNTNSYQKASWFLHMLHENMGDSMFFMSLREYYRIYKDSTALTKDFQSVAEKISAQDLDLFFHQWLWQPGFPKIKVEWNQRFNKKVKLKVSQTQIDYSFNFPLEIEFQLKNGERKIETLQISNPITIMTFRFDEKVKEIRLDPFTKLLFEEI